MRKNRAQMREDRIFGIVEKLFDNEDIVRSLIVGVGGAAIHMPWHLEVELKNGGYSDAFFGKTGVGRTIQTQGLRVVFWIQSLASPAYGFGPRIDGEVPSIPGGSNKFALGLTLTPNFYRIEFVLQDETIHPVDGDTRTAATVIKEHLSQRYLPLFQMLFLAYGFGIGTLGAQLLTAAVKGGSTLVKTGAEYVKGVGEVIPG